MTEPQEPPCIALPLKRKLAWARELIQDVEKYGPPKGTMTQSKKPNPFYRYVALMCDLVDQDPTFLEETL